MKADLLYYRRMDYEDGAIAELVLWRVPAPVLPSSHGLKYSLFYGRPGVREIGYAMNVAKATTGISKALKLPTTLSMSSG
jgi:hypothetical protein